MNLLNVWDSGIADYHIYFYERCEGKTLYNSRLLSNLLLYIINNYNLNVIFETLDEISQNVLLTRHTKAFSKKIINLEGITYNIERT